ncbi:MAG TPA: alpha/beta hydrolase [Devosia sp.]|nr:alpha/beta hydrolase [Devosia sp.]
MFKALIAAALAAALAGPALAETAAINGLDMYYEVTGDGPPLVLLHGAYGSADDWKGLTPTFAATHKVIAVDLQAHGRTTDRDTPITYEDMADDVAALLDHLKIGDATIFGYSMGGGVALQVAVRHPEKVNRLVAASAGISYDALPDGFEEMIGTITPELFAGTILETSYLGFGRSKAEFASLVGKLRDLDLKKFTWPDAAIAAIAVPTLLIFGDADIVEMEHVTKLYRLLGGITDGDTNGLPKLQLAILPGTPHTGVLYNPHNIELLKTIVPTFLAQELPQKPQNPF